MVVSVGNDTDVREVHNAKQPPPDMVVSAGKDMDVSEVQ
jgi:hypothetical protein